MQLTDEQIKEVAEELQSEMKCFVHQKTGKVISYPDPDRNMAIQEEYWQEQIAEIEANFDDYLEMESMSSLRSFQVMEDFVKALLREKYGSRLFIILNSPKPFRHFKYEIEGSAYREQWFAFRNQEMLTWERGQL